MCGPPELAVVVPVYNEVDGIAAFAERWLSALERSGITYELHFYDDGSTDGSGLLLANLEHRHRRLMAHRHDNRGHGPSIVRGYLEHADTPWTLQLDADDTIGPDVFARLWPQRGEFDLLIASRRDPARPWLRRALTHLARSAVTILFAAGIRDVNSPYRLVRNAPFREGYDLLSPGLLLPNILLSGVACRRGLRILQHEVETRGRQRPESLAGRLRWIRLAVSGGAQLIPRAWRLRRG